MAEDWVVGGAGVRGCKNVSQTYGTMSVALTIWERGRGDVAGNCKGTIKSTAKQIGKINIHPGDYKAQCEPRSYE
jgi:hypothetical protein